MSVSSRANDAKFKAAFSEFFVFEKQLPEQVFNRKNQSKFVIGESGMFHKKSIFEKLCQKYGDKNLNYYMIDPPEVLYSIDFDKEFSNVWSRDLLGFLQENHDEPKVWPWMIAGLQCYFGSSMSWCSYHDNHVFELDIFQVPINCDTEHIFGPKRWDITDFQDSVRRHGLNLSDFEVEKLRMNYFS